MTDQSHTELYCCQHEALCAVHQQPFDNSYTACTCALGAASLRHERTVRQARPAGVSDARELSRAALGALIALESGQREVAARLLSDLVARSALAASCPDPGLPQAGSGAAGTRDNGAAP